MFDSDAHDYQSAYDLWQLHNNKPQKNTELTTLVLLRKTFPKYHVTETNPEQCDLLGYAAAGHATATPEGTHSHFTRSYHAPESRHATTDAKVTDDVRYGCCRYQWRGTDFLVYQATYKTSWGLTKVLYVLHPDSPEARTNDSTDALLLECGKWTKDLHGEIFVFDNMRWSKSTELWKSVDGSSWDDVILEAGMKDRLIYDVQNFFDTRRIYQASNVPWKRGVILHGLPGNGKTVSVRALINSLAKRDDPIPSLYVKSLDGCNGPKYSIQQIFRKARAMAPCLLVFEDLDSLVTSKTRSYFLNEVDGLESNDGILMIGSTNYLERLDAAITKRPSRFDRKYHFKLPAEEARLAYARYWSRKFSEPNEIVDFPEALCPIIAKITGGFSFAYMKELFIASLLALARKASTEPGVEDLVTEGSTTSEEPVIVGEEDKPDAAEDKGQTTKEKAVEVKVEIPEELKGSAFLQVLLEQAAILKREMESTDKSEVPMASCAVDGCDDVSSVGGSE
ncbi:proteasome-activating nucleotidase [Cercophora newfieldiana]|uniref:Proteasome-activating nucleotidase n=1 Tax=Cercophora newfieldiana TaxID=92897 RepID=A0AA39Y9X6_9PEZI|nr:proteasome-activating nucleotidase [Cercophora newfieldiana]